MDQKRLKTLSEQEIVTRCVWDRRAVMGAAAAAAVATVVAVPAMAQGISDRDAGPGADPPGRGRHGTYTGRTDQDPNDPANGGRGGTATPRRQTGVTDRDSGPGSDPPGGGRGGAGSQSTGISDTDSGPGSDPAGHGRGQVAGRGANSRDSDFRERPWNSDRYPSDSDRRDPQGEGRGSAAWAQRHAQGPTGGRPPQAQPPGQRQGAGDVADVGLGRNDAAQFLVDVQDSNRFTRRPGRSDAELAGRTPF
jgi:hypothetical protein